MINNTLLDALIEFNQLNEHQIHELHTPPKLVFSEHPLFSKASELIREAIVQNRKIIVCGDYDADGAQLGLGDQWPSHCDRSPGRASAHRSRPARDTRQWCRDNGIGVRSTRSRRRPLLGYLCAG